MQTNVLTPVNAPAVSRVEHLFNSYLYQLRSLEQVAASPQSMAAHTALVAADEAGGTRHVAEMGSMLRGLHVLSNSLQQLATCLSEAYMDLEEFLDGKDFQYFAASKRLTDARERGYTDEADVSADGRRLVLRTEPEALAPFQLRVVLANYFTNTTAQGERIGSSKATDYAYYSSFIVDEIVFRLRDTEQPATPTNITAYRRSEAQELGITEVKRPDERFEFDSEALHGPELVAKFNDLLLQGQEAAALYHGLAQDDIKGYEWLFKLLSKMVNAEDDIP